MNACLLSTAFKSSSLFLIKTESILQTVKVDFFSDKLRPALDTLIGLGFEVASERFFFLGLAKVFFCFGVEFLLFIGSAVGVENSTQDVSGTSIALLRVSGGGSLGVAETSEKRRGVVGEGRFEGAGGFVEETSPSERQSASEGGFEGRKMSMEFMYTIGILFSLRRLSMFLLNLFLSPAELLCAMPKHAMVLYTISTAAYFSKFLGIVVMGSFTSRVLDAFV